MNYVYLISNLILLVLIILIKKTNNKLNIVPTIVFTMVGNLLYQFTISLVFSSLNIPINMIYMSSLNIIIVVMCMISLYIKGVQKFYFHKKDFIVSLVLVILAVFIANAHFDGFEKIKYFSTDASIHYIAAKEFSENDKLLNETQGTQTYKQMPPILYTNVGLAFKVFKPIIGGLNLYKIYIAFDIMIFLLTGLTFYLIIKRAIKDGKGYVLALTATMIYMQGYPLNNLITGFGYLGFCLVFINTIILVMQNIQREDIQKEVKLLTLLLLNVAVIFSYNIFAIFVYMAEFIYLIILNKWQHNVKLIIYVLITLIFPGVLGLIYFILPNIKAVEVVSLEGYIYQNMWSNFILFIPFSLYYMYKTKKVNFKIVLFITCLIYTLLFFIGTNYKIISEYYAYKSFYVFWGITIILCFYGMMEFAKNSNKKLIAITTFFIAYIFGMFWVPQNREIPIKQKQQETLEGCFDIYCINKELMALKMDLNKNELDAIKYIETNELLNIEEQNVLFLSDYIQEAWIRVLIDYKNREGKIEKNNYKSQIEKWNNNSYEYLVCFKDSNVYKGYNVLVNYNEAMLIYSNEQVQIYKKDIEVEG